MPADSSLGGLRCKSSMAISRFRVPGNDISDSRFQSGLLLDRSATLNPTTYVPSHMHWWHDGGTLESFGAGLEMS